MEANKRAMWDADDCALIIIDYQKEMFARIRSSDPALVELNIRTLARAAKAFGVPIILSTVGVDMKVNGPTIESLRKELTEFVEIDRTSMNAWEDPVFLKAIKDTGKKKLIFCALWTEICLAFPVVDALADGFECAIIVDAVGGQSKIEHDAAVWRMVHAGAVINTTCAAVAEFFRDWKSPRADRGREILVSYWTEKSHMQIPAGESHVPRSEDRQQPSPSH